MTQGRRKGLILALSGRSGDAVERARPARLGKFFQPGSDIDAIAIDRTPVGNHIAQVHGYAEGYAPIFRHTRILISQLFLRRYRTFGCSTAGRQSQLLGMPPTNHGQEFWLENIQERF